MPRSGDLDESGARRPPTGLSDPIPVVQPRFEPPPTTFAGLRSPAADLGVRTRPLTIASDRSPWVSLPVLARYRLHHMDVRPPVAHTSLGDLAGVTVATHSPNAHGSRPDRFIEVFRGIPYALAPVGPLRFAPPVPISPWSGVRMTDRFGPMAPQVPGLLESMLDGGGVAVDEDNCLTLNVWTPACDHGNRPVMVWIHGGAFLTGGGAVSWYDGTRFATDGDVVVVTINYRLGVFGFLHLDDAPDSGTAGLADQIEALRWVQNNIAAFGGDPDRVTVFGESAGAMSIGAMLGAPSARGLFRRAVLQSGACANVNSSEQAELRTTQVCDALGLAAATADQLRAIPAADLLAAQQQVLSTGGTALPFQPVWGGSLLPVHPLAAIKDGMGAQPEAVLHGTTLDEMRLFTAWDSSLTGIDGDGVVSRARARHGDSAKDVVDLYRSIHPSFEWGQVWSAMETDAVFRIPAHDLVNALRTTGVPSWQYVFAWPTPLLGGRMGACHAVEIPFVFNNVRQPGASQFLGAAQHLEELSAHMNQAWIRFAHGDAPHPQWPAEDESHPVWRFHNDVTAGLVSDPFGRERSCWHHS